MTRGFRPPYGENYLKAGSRLQIPSHEGAPLNTVERQTVGWLEAVAGPRTAWRYPEFGKGGGLEWYRGGEFDQ